MPENPQDTHPNAENKGKKCVDPKDYITRRQTAAAFEESLQTVVERGPCTTL